MFLERVIYDASGAIGRITLNRAEKRNALDPQMIAELTTAILHADSAAPLRVITITGAGKDFCSGADLAAVSAVAERGVMENIADARSLAQLFGAIRRASKPVVALARGRTLAGGCGLATACDVVLAAQSAQFGYPEVNIGFVPAMVMAILRRALSERAAFELLISGDIVTAERALEIGLVQHVFSDDQFDYLANAYIEKLAGKPPAAVALTKRLLYRIDTMPFDAAIEAGVDANAIARMTDDFRQGVDRFLKKA